MDSRVMLATALLTTTLFVICVFGDTSAGNTSQPCSCASDAEGGCVPNQLCDPDNNCNKENVAYGKTATMSSRHRPWPNVSGPACVAVNGRTGHKFKYLNENDTNCVHTAENDPHALWQVDLGQNYTITDITIYNRIGLTQRLEGIWIFVNDNICKKLPSDNSQYDLISTVTCDTPLRGHIVTMSKNGSTTSFTQFIDFCEVQIWVCKPGRFGQSCDQTCQCHNNGTCDNHFGTCLKVIETESDLSTLAGPISGAIVGGFLLLGVSILIVGLCRRRAPQPTSVEEVPAAVVSGSSASSTAEQISSQVMTSPDTTMAITEGERDDYDCLEYQTDDRSPYDTPVFTNGDREDG